MLPALQLAECLSPGASLNFAEVVEPAACHAISGSNALKACRAKWRPLPRAVRRHQQYGRVFLPAHCRSVRDIFHNSRQNFQGGVVMGVCGCSDGRHGPSFPYGCFVAGTLVWTDKGLVPIEQIKVGDMVLSKPENGTGELAYKLVVNTFVHEDKEIWFFEYYDMDTGNPSYLYGTANHPIWVKGKGWISIDSLSRGDLCELEDGKSAAITLVQRVFATIEQDTGFRLLGDIHLKDHMGRCIDFANINDPKNDEYPFKEDYLGSSNIFVSDGKHWYKTFTRQVFNIEVEDSHTYFVGQPGVWVHSANCSGAASGFISQQ
ncbi:MAG TPA: polymorphic toxin-type HINT domain-containing protein [Gallionellaceae bacterium]